MAETPVEKTPTRTPRDNKETIALFDRIDALEKRCITLQKRLNARPAAQQNFDSVIETARQRPTWALTVMEKLGPRVGEVLIIAYTLMNVALVKATRLLLTREMWRWLFFTHLVFLYTAMATWYSQTVADPASPIDGLNIRIDKAAASNSVGQIGHGG